MKEWGEEVKESAQNFSNRAKEFSNTRGKAFASEFGETARRSRNGIGHAIGVIFKAFFLFIAGTIAFALFVSLIALLFGGVAWWPINNFLWTSKWQQIYAWGTLIFFLIVPLIGFIIWLVRRIIRVRSRSSYLGWTFGLLWTIGWVSVILLASSLTQDFREYKSSNITVPITQPANGKMIVAVSEPELEFTGRFDWINDGGNGWDLSDDTIKLSTVKFNFQKSIDGDYHVIVKKYGFGRTEEDALIRAEKIQYNLSFRDSILDLGNGYAIDKGSKFRGQQVEIEIQIPVGKKIRFDRTVNEKLNPVNFRIKRSYRRNRVVNIQVDDYYSQRLRSETDYIMGSDNNLRDAEGNTPTNGTTTTTTSTKNGSDYRYDRKDSAPQNVNPDIQRQIEEERKKDEQRKEQRRKEDEETERKIKELKQKAEENKTTGFKKENSTRSEESIVAGPSPVSSMTQWF
jgi:hypothetical protein